MHIILGNGINSVNVVNVVNVIIFDTSCAVEREVRGSIPVWEYVLQGPMSEFETR